MFLGIKKIKSVFERESKNGILHCYSRSKTLVLLRCDACRKEFTRELGSMDRKRLNNYVYHVCDFCDSKRFAQQKSAERRRFWNMSADAEIDISKT